MRPVLFSLVLLTPTLALAAGKPQPADKHDPPLFTDVTANWINVAPYDFDYDVKAAFRLHGAHGKKDRVRLDWKAGGKVIGSMKCGTDFYESSQTLQVSCDGLEKHVTATGNLDADLIFTDDQTDTEYLVNTFHVVVKSWPRVGKYMNWGLLPDDTLAVAFVRHWRGEEAFHKPVIEFWSTAPLLGNGDTTLRCTVDGKKLPDFKAPVGAVMAAGQRQVQVDVNTNGQTRQYRYDHLEVDPDFRFGSKDDFASHDASAVPWLIDNPGKWDCFLRKDGKPVREFLFTVNDKGMVEPSQMQKGAHPVPTPPGVVLIDMKIPADNGVERRIRPDAMKKGIGFGVAWPDGPGVKEIQASFPPSSGLPD